VSHLMTSQFVDWCRVGLQELRDFAYNQMKQNNQRGIKLKWVLSPKMAIMTAHSELLRHAVNMAQSISATLSTNLEFWVIIHKNCDNADIRNISVHGIAYAIAHNYKIMTVRQIRRFKF